MSSRLLKTTVFLASLAALQGAVSASVLVSPVSRSGFLTDGLASVELDVGCCGASSSATSGSLPTPAPERRDNRALELLLGHASLPPSGGASSAASSAAGGVPVLQCDRSHTELADARTPVAWLRGELTLFIPDPPGSSLLKPPRGATVASID